MKFIVDKDGIKVSGKNNTYEQTRRRVTGHYNNRNMSDKEIIELLDKEIEQYREGIQKQKEYIKQLQERHIQSEVVELDTIDETIDDNIKEITTTNIFANGNLIQSTTNYKYIE